MSRKLLTVIQWAANITTFFIVLIWKNDFTEAVVVLFGMQLLWSLWSDAAIKRDEAKWFIVLTAVLYLAGALANAGKDSLNVDVYTVLEVIFQIVIVTIGVIVYVFVAVVAYLPVDAFLRGYVQPRKGFQEPTEVDLKHNPLLAAFWPTVLKATEVFQSLVALMLIEFVLSDGQIWIINFWLPTLSRAFDALAESLITAMP